MDKWSTGAAALIRMLLDHPDMTQSKLAEKLNITQSAVSGRQNRAFYYEVRDLETLFSEKIQRLLDQ
jgi:predicted transcriptional regulator